MSAFPKKTQESHSQPALSEIQSLFRAIIESGKINRVTQQRFMQAMMQKKTITAHDEALINQVFDLLRAGRLRVVD
jgi:hypothetical protein